MVDYNRFVYVRGNPLKFSDPSGHIGVCFTGAPMISGEVEVATDNLMRMCEGMFNDGMFGAASTWGRYRNTLSDLWKAFGLIQEELAKAKAENRQEPVILIGYSWGGAAAMELARMLNEFPVLFGGEPVRVDALVTIDPVTFGRKSFSFGWYTTAISPNVKRYESVWQQRRARSHWPCLWRFGQSNEFCFLPDQSTTASVWNPGRT